MTDMLASARLVAWALACTAAATLVVAAGPGVAQAADCSTSAQYGACSYPPYVVNQDMWNPGSGSYQTLNAASAGQWSVTTYQPTGAAVRSYPNVSESLGQPISDFASAAATFSDSTPAGAAANAAFDLWVNGAPGTSDSAHYIEVMIWTANYGNYPAGTKKATVKIGGQTFAVWECKSGCVGHPYYAFVLNHKESSGEVHILTALRWLVHRGLIPSSDPLTAVDCGWEIRNTGGATLTFAMTSYSLQATLKGLSARDRPAG